MALIDVIPYDLSHQLKELGFDEPCLYHYKKSITDDLVHSKHPTFQVNEFFGKNHNLIPSRVSAPLTSQAFRWFRDNYEIHHTIMVMSPEAIAASKDKPLKKFSWYVWIKNSKYPTDCVGKGRLDSYEKCELAALTAIIGTLI